MTSQSGHPPINALRARLAGLECKSYPAYKSVKGWYKADHCQLAIDHIQGDPFAEPSKLRLVVAAATGAWPDWATSSPSREIAFRDFLARRFHELAQPHSKLVGSGKGGLLEIDPPVQQVLERTAVILHADGSIEARVLVGLPANGRRILGKEAARIVCDVLPEVARLSLLADNNDLAALQRHVETVEDADWLRLQLSAHGLVAFVADGARLARHSGIDDRPLADGQPFESAPTMRVEFERPNGGKITGLGVPQGVSLIVGGGYHGKSTLLRAIEYGIYNHLPGDGREFVVTDEAAVKIRAEDGRAVSNVTITPFISNLPFGRDTQAFSTDNASGSTSQAANIIEAIEAGAKVLLLDEDTSATNFMIRDRRMQELIAKDREPITPFTDRVGQLFQDRQISTVLVMGGSGDYFDHADHVLAMHDYQPADVSRQAKDIAAQHQTGRQYEGGPEFGKLQARALVARSLDPSRGRRPYAIRVRRTEELEFGEHRIDLNAVEQLVHPSQLRSIAACMHWLSESVADGARDVPALIAALVEHLQAEGLAVLSDRPDGNLAAVRPIEVMAAVNRVRDLQVKGV